MRTFRMYVEMENDAMLRPAQLQALLYTVIGKLHGKPEKNEMHTLLDDNGNRVGWFMEQVQTHSAAKANAWITLQESLTAARILRNALDKLWEGCRWHERGTGEAMDGMFEADYALSVTSHIVEHPFNMTITSKNDTSMHGDTQ